MSYEVLARIADGLGVPRGHLGLAYDDSTAQLVGAVAPANDESEQRRLMARLTELTLGAGTVDPRSWAQPFAVAWAQAPDRIGLSDVARLEAITAQLRAVDYEQGGGACRDAVLAQVGWAQQLLQADTGAEIERPLHVAVADLHVLAGWTSFDIGMIGPARRHFARALEHARFADEPSLVARVLYCLARVHMHHGWGGQAVRLLQLGLVAAQQSGSARAAAMVHANLAWAHSMVGDARATGAEVERARDEYARSDREDVPHWLRFFNSAELQALRGVSIAYLPNPTSQQRSEAIERFSISTALRELPMARSRTFELTALAWMLLDNGDGEQAVQVGHQAVDLAERIRSHRVVDRFAPLTSSLRRHPGDGDLRDLAARIQALRRPT